MAFHKIDLKVQNILWDVVWRDSHYVLCITPHLDKAVLIKRLVESKSINNYIMAKLYEFSNSLR
jgi:hypothetical protein